MLKKTNFVLLFMLATICLFAQNVDKPVIVVTPIDLYDVDQKTGDMLTRRMQSEFSQTMKFTVVDRNSFDKIFAQLKFQNTEWSNPNKIAQMKNAFNAQYIVTSSIEQYDKKLYITANIIDVNSTVIIASENAKFASIGELMGGGVKDIVTKIASQVTSTDMSAEIAKKPVIVLTAFDLYDVDEKNGNLLLRNMQTEFVKTKQFVVVDRNSFEKILTELKFQDSEWSNPDKIAALKKAFNAKYIVNTSIDNSGSVLYITSNIIDVNSTAIFASVNSDVASVNELLNGKLLTLVNEIVWQINPSLKPKPPKVYKIGDRGPGGGIVFYVSQEGFNVYDAHGDSKIYHYLEVSDVLSSYITWCPEKPRKSCCYPRTKPQLGYGKKNTYIIIHTNHRGGIVDSSNCAAYLCTQYYTSTTKAGDWWLPTYDELELIYTNLKCNWYISDNGYFWSSDTSADGEVAGYLAFSSGSIGLLTKSSHISVRAVRAF